MNTYKEFIEAVLVEARKVFDPTEYLTKQDKKVELFIGRFQPPHIGHMAIIKKMKNPVVALVKGAKSSKDTTRNPLDGDTQVRLLKKAMPGVTVMVVASGYIPDILNTIRKEGMEVTAMYAGEDRFSMYSSQIEKFNERVEDDQKMEVQMKKTPRVTSATDVRNSIKDDDYETFKKLMPKALHGEWDMLRKKITQP